MIPQKSLETFFRYARERYRIFLKRQQGLPKPWTKDPVLQRYRFCNVRREDDRVTKWFADNWRGVGSKPATTFGCIAFRFFNRIETGKVLVRSHLLDDWRPYVVRTMLSKTKPLVGAAYIINTSGSPGKKKLEGLIDILNPIWEAQQKGELSKFKTIQEAHERISQFWYVGNFMAYQSCADLRWTPVLYNATDVNTWACAGPGTARGLARLMNEPVTRFKYGNPKGQAEMLPLLRELLAASYSSKYWPQSYPNLELSDVSNWCCETDKILRVKLGEGEPKQRYNGHSDSYSFS